MDTNNSLNIKEDGEPSVLLISSPWMKSSWPSLAIGSLKAYLEIHSINVRCCHFHLEAAARIGWSNYDALAETWGAGEALFGALLDPEDSKRLVNVAVNILLEAKKPQAAEWAQKAACRELSEMVESWLDRESSEKFSVIGGSIGAMQLCGTLYLMKRIQERGHKGLRVLGGSGIVGEVGRTLLERFSGVDIVVQGEGENALLNIVKQHASQDSIAKIGGILFRDEMGSIKSNTASIPLNLLDAPTPNLSEFYDSASKMGIPKTALTLSFEHSRGCEWEHRIQGELKGCTFCGLYRGAPNHRRKQVSKVIKEVEESIEKYRVLDIAFVDAYIPTDYRDELIIGLNRIPADLTYFTEMRCDLNEATVRILSKKVAQVQLGVESFSTAILKHIGKGVDCVHSVHSVRLCQEYGINTQYNIMTRIPGVTIDEIEELCELIPKLFGLTPPTLAEFYLDRNSLIYLRPMEHGVTPSKFDCKRPDWLANSLGDSRISQIVPFENIEDKTEIAWSKVDELLKKWNEQWRLAKSLGLSAPLIWRDGNGWASVVDARQGMAKIYTLEGILYDVFLACREVVSERKLILLLPQHESSLIKDALKELVLHDLVVNDGARYLIVVVRVSTDFNLENYEVVKLKSSKPLSSSSKEITPPILTH